MNFVDRLSQLVLPNKGRTESSTVKKRVRLLVLFCLNSRVSGICNRFTWSGRGPGKRLTHSDYTEGRPTKKGQDRGLIRDIRDLWNQRKRTVPMPHF